MPKINWIVATAFGLVCAFGVFKSGEYFLSYQEQQADDRATSAHYDTAASDQRPSPCGAVMLEGGFFDWLACFGDDVTSPSGEKAAEYDLKAQQDMAVWALGMLIITFWLTVITLGGVFFVWLTLKATRKMAIDTMLIGQAQVRAYISISGMDITLNATSGTARIKGSINNHGQSPAVRFTHGCMTINEPSDTDISSYSIESFSPEATISSGSQSPIEIDMATGGEYDMDWLNRIISGEDRLWVVCEGNYFDVFGNTRHSYRKVIALNVAPDVPRFVVLQDEQRSEKIN